MTSSAGRPTGHEWLITDFVERVPGVAHGVIVSADGDLLAGSAGLPPARAGELATVVTGMLGMTAGVADCLAAGRVHQAVVEMELGFLLLMTVSDGSCVAALASPRSDMGTVAYEMSLLVERLGQQRATSE
ncbi:roadblock/LC7 domain-containing protein [Haloechinothrix sp. YIM 98757]|uniref:Roadblock/LC7 domain-containing protein n=1 Tax=Haloechinothrix aidingensis TaxID=2752311 RepID=A0A838AEP2_9PSEU|nr:roadblock/LC7 domain-containing protein [Haloechinothrix aidingensis]